MECYGVFVGEDPLHPEWIEPGVSLEGELAKQRALKGLAWGNKIDYKDNGIPSGYRIAVLKPNNRSVLQIATIGFHQDLTEPPEIVGIRVISYASMVDVVVKHPNNPDQKVYGAIHRNEGLLSSISKKRGIFTFPLFFNAIDPSQYKEMMSYVNQQMKNTLLDREQTDYQTAMFQNLLNSS